MRFVRLLSDYRWPIFLGGLLTMSVASSGVLVYVATRPDAPRPIPGYYQAAQAWDETTAATAASSRLGWTVRYELPADVPYSRGMPRPLDVTIIDRQGAPVSGLTGWLSAIRPSDSRLNQRGALVALPAREGQYRTLIQLDEPGRWEIQLDTTRQDTRFVHTTRFDVAPGSVTGGQVP
jgi:hypothetical protein